MNTSCFEFVNLVKKPDIIFIDSIVNYVFYSLFVCYQPIYFTKYEDGKPDVQDFQYSLLISIKLAITSPIMTILINILSSFTSLVCITFPFI